MTWYGRDGWGSCGSVFNDLAMAVFWGAVVTAILLAVHYLITRRSNQLLMTTGTTGAEGAAAVSPARGEMDNDEFYRRLM
jgi:putative membrane protein